MKFKTSSNSKDKTKRSFKKKIVRKGINEIISCLGCQGSCMQCPAFTNNPNNPNNRNNPVNPDNPNNSNNLDNANNAINANNIKKISNPVRELDIALVGSPNSGKTTIFNNITGAKQHVGNYPGVTVEIKTGTRKYNGYKLNFIDLPGTYSLTAFSEEERITRNFILKEKPDIVLNIIDASNLERNLYLTTQLIELNCQMILVFNMADLMEKSGLHLDLELLSNLLGASIVLTVGSKNLGTQNIIDEIIKINANSYIKKNIKINYGDEIENELIKITKLLSSIINSQNKAVSFNNYIINYNLEWVSLKLLEQDNLILKELSEVLSLSDLNKLTNLVDGSINHIKKITGYYPNTLIAEARYGFIKGALKESAIVKGKNDVLLSDKIDQVLLNKVFGLPIFAVIMWLIFQLVFKIGDYPTRWLQLGFNKLSELLSVLMPDSLLKSLLIDGVIGGVGGVLVFIPKIMILFICIAFLEDSGYMARAAFIMDRIMHKIGLHGKSFIPMLIGFGCTVPAYMCSRTLENKNDRLITLHINTFMSCGGRLPIYILFAGTFFTNNAGNVIFAIYLIGILMAVVFAKVLRATRFRGESEPFVMELPVYRMPTLRGILIHMWERTWHYIKKAGTVILSISIIIWILFTFPRINNEIVKPYNDQIVSLEQKFSQGLISNSELDLNIKKIKQEMSLKQLDYSSAGRIGHFIEPLFKPLGFDWRLALASIAGIAGKEVVVSTLGTTFSISGASNGYESLRSSLKDAYNPLIGFNFMLFCLLYFPCIAGLAVFQREAGTKEMIFQIFFTITLAWVVSLIVYQIGKFFI